MPFQPVPARLECHSSLSVSPAPTRSALLLPEAAATLLDRH
jgi:hypothetical protein